MTTREGMLTRKDKRKMKQSSKRRIRTKVHMMKRRKTNIMRWNELWPRCCAVEFHIISYGGRASIMETATLKSP